MKWGKVLFDIFSADIITKLIFHMKAFIYHFMDHTPNSIFKDVELGRIDKSCLTAKNQCNGPLTTVLMETISNCLYGNKTYYECMLFIV